MVNFDTDIILAVCLMDEEEMEAVKKVMFARLEVNHSEDKSEKEEPASSDETQRNEDDEVPLKTLHTISSREQENVFSCDNCKKTFKRRNSLNKHKRHVKCSFEESHEIVEVNKDIIKKEVEEVTTLDELTDDDLAKSEYFNSTSYPTIVRLNQETDIDEFTDEDVRLPGWKIRNRQVFSANKKSKVMNKRAFLTPNKKRKIMTSLGVLEYLRLQGRPDAELLPLAHQLGIDGRRFAKLHVPERSAGETLRQLSDRDLAKSRYFNHEVSHPIIRKVLKNSIHEYSKEDNVLPGWRIKARIVRRDHRQRKLKTFLTPRKSRSISTSTGVLEYLRLQGKQKTELAQVAQHLGVDKSKFESLF